MKSTLASIAKLSGVSISTVSRVLGGRSESCRISKETAEKVFAAASKLNYSPSLVANSLNQDHSNLIGLMLPTLANPYFAEMAGTIISECRLRNYTILVMDSMEDEKLFTDGISAMVSRHLAGIIAAPCGKDPLFLESINRDQCPVVLIDRFYKNSSLPYVTTNNYAGALQATNLLIANGHRRIACIQGVVTSMPNSERVRGYRDAMSAAQLTEFISVYGDDFSINNGYTETLGLFTSAEEKPTAIFALSNTICLGVVKALKELGLKIKEDVSVIAFDNNVNMEYIDPPITRISQPTEDMAKTAVKVLCTAIKEKVRISSEIKLSPKIISGQSIGGQA